jgi:hypothetical protein
VTAGKMRFVNSNSSCPIEGRNTAVRCVDHYLSADNQA